MHSPSQCVINPVFLRAEHFPALAELNQFDDIGRILLAHHYVWKMLSPYKRGRYL